MTTRVFTISIIILSIISCASIKAKQPLEIIKSYSESWTTENEKHRGTTLTLELSGAIDSIEVTELIYNKRSIKPIVKKDRNKLIVTADFESGTENVFGKYRSSNKENMVVYKQSLKEHQILIKKIERNPTKYYPTN